LLLAKVSPPLAVRGCARKGETNSHFEALELVRASDELLLS